MERGIKAEYNLEIYDKSKGGQSLAQDNKYQYYIT